MMLQLREAGYRQVRVVVAARSMNAAAKAFNTPVGQVRQYACETGNATEIEVANSKPGKVFWAERLGKEYFERLES